MELRLFKVRKENYEDLKKWFAKKQKSGEKINITDIEKQLQTYEKVK